jgi:mannose-1-phosphate guanylyltransferase
MKAFLLAAGYGTRLKPLTDHVPKCLLPIRGVPLLEIWLELCGNYGINEVLINTHSYEGAVKKYVEENSTGFTIRVSEEGTLLGSAGTLLKNRDWVGSDSAFWVFYADVLTNANLAHMLEFHNQHRQAATMGVYEVSNPKQCGIVTTDREGIVREFVEKPASPSSNLAFAGLLIATPELFDVIPSEIPADIGFHVLPQFAGRMAAYHISDYIMDIGTPEKYKQAQETWPGLFAGAQPRNRTC